MSEALPLPSAEELHRLFSLDEATGTLLWRYREDRLANWNALYAGKPAGTPRSDGYTQVRLHGHFYVAHRIIWKLKTGRDPVECIDHESGSRADNRPGKIREATRSQNSMNRRSTGPWPKGVTRNRRGKFVAQIKGAGCKQYLGSFDTPEEAHARYVVMADLWFGEFACLSR